MYFLTFNVAFLLVLVQVRAEYFRNASVVEAIRMPNYNNDDCINRNDNPYDIRVYNKVEVLNVLDEYPLRELLSERNIMTVDNITLNRYLYCIWKQKLYINARNEINYPLLEQITADAVAKVVGGSGPAINLSRVYARSLLFDTQTIEDNNVAAKIARIQNHIVINLQTHAWWD